ncbi:glucuronyl esterase domain-containing protein [Planctomicrobium piriforme]|uniref:4-O-methyl-glucuronoyl methylesterase-like domain-containing protein n=1 Tax=Planctomicrobium piriforme TaxID=1576369 RepID=A0A1I3D0W2_9PLAN|nr:acetylxylan esterase [Planctomicrobium piriforme]SFH80268.1 hypothetical protein SAMN05421753_10342 [Planctomicrobium piriforme]
MPDLNRIAYLMAAGCVLTAAVDAAPPPTHTDEAQVPAYTLPDPLKFADGSAVSSAKDWTERRRPQLLELFAEQMFGKAPPAPKSVKTRTLSEKDVFGGTAIRKEIEVTLVEQPTPVTMTILLYLPKTDKPVPVFLGLNFRGNHTVTTEPDVALNTNWMENKTPGVVDHRATEESRGSQASRWPVEMLLKRGYGLATAYYGDIDPDFHDGFQNGVHPAFAKSGQSQPAPDEWGSIAAWAWGMSRGLDALEQESRVNAKQVIAIGHSRLGKTALWVGATDPRFAIVISNDSGCGGAALSRRHFGETVARINYSFPHWFCENFKQFNENEAALPFDQHELIALIAPRPVYVASAAEDLWADPKGEYLSAIYADPVYRLLGTDGIGGAAPSTELPPVDHPISNGTIGYHIRTGKHDINDFDWEQYLNFADRHLRARKN